MDGGFGHKGYGRVRVVSREGRKKSSARKSAKVVLDWERGRLRGG